MRRSLQFAALGALLALPMFGTTSAQAQATRTWVSGVGDDVNPCSRTAPCKTFAGAISKTAAAGEINCLDPGGFGTVTITKSMTIDCQGTFGSLLSSSVNGVNVNDSATATPGTIVVNLKNITINGAPGTGLVGVNFISGLAVHLDNVTIENFQGGTAVGVRMATTNAGVRFLNINDSYLWNNGNGTATGGGVLVQPGAGSAAKVMINNTKIEFGASGITTNGVSGAITMTVANSSVANNRGTGLSLLNAGSVLVDNTQVNTNGAFGIQATGATSVLINRSAVFANSTGVGGGGTFRSYKNNAINGNATDGTPITQEALN